MTAIAAHPIELGGESVVLLPHKALWWPRRRILVVADIHFGKAAAFRAMGIPVPHGTTGQNLAQLDRLVQHYLPLELIFLGDFLHARASHARGTMAAIGNWRARHAAMQLTLVRGNHDRHAGDPTDIGAIHIVNEPYDVAPFAFCHHPDIDTANYVLAGHVHPVLRLKSRLDSFRLPCFLIGPHRAILPSFGAFTGGYAVTPAPDESVYVTTGDAVLHVRT